MQIKRTNFDWDPSKNASNYEKHQVAFESAQQAFSDPNRIIAFDKKHSTAMVFLLWNSRRKHTDGAIYLER